VESNQKLVQTRVEEVERVEKSMYGSLFSPPPKSPYKVLGGMPFQEIQQWTTLDDVQLHTKLSAYGVKPETFKRWQQILPDITRQVPGAANKSFKEVIDIALRARPYN
jgi:hypothetical protein